MTPVLHKIHLSFIFLSPTVAASVVPFSRAKERISSVRSELSVLSCQYFDVLGFQFLDVKVPYVASIRVLRKTPEKNLRHNVEHCLLHDCRWVRGTPDGQWSDSRMLPLVFVVDG